MDFLGLVLRVAINILIIVAMIVSFLALGTIVVLTIDDFSVGRLLLAIVGFVVFCFELAGANRWFDYISRNYSDW